MMNINNEKFRTFKKKKKKKHDLSILPASESKHCQEKICFQVLWYKQRMFPSIMTMIKNKV